jgi:hypothetical protein
MRCDSRSESFEHHYQVSSIASFGFICMSLTRACTVISHWATGDHGFFGVSAALPQSVIS